MRRCSGPSSPTCGWSRLKVFDSGTNPISLAKLDRRWVCSAAGSPLSGHWSHLVAWIEHTICTPYSGQFVPFPWGRRSNHLRQTVNSIALWAARDIDYYQTGPRDSACTHFPCSATTLGPVRCPMRQADGISCCENTRSEPHRGEGLHNYRIPLLPGKTGPVNANVSTGESL